MSVTIISKDEAKSPKALFDDYEQIDRENAKKAREARQKGGVFVAKDPPIPWVQIKGLYVAVTITGENSWRPLLDQLYGGGSKVFNVVTGRHGDPLGSPVQQGVLCRDQDSSHYAQDEERAKEARKTYVGDSEFRLNLFDAGKPPLDNIQKLRTATTFALQRDEIVIFAWCYSLWSVKEYSGSLGASEFQSLSTVEVNKSVRTIVRDCYGWLPGDIINS